VTAHACWRRVRWASRGAIGKVRGAARSAGVFACHLSSFQAMAACYCLLLLPVTT